MKIGILTYHRSHNYGALLQAIALRHILSQMGHSVTFIDYWPTYHEYMYKPISWTYVLSKKGLRRKINYAINCLRNYKYRKSRVACFNSFIEKYIFPYISSMEEEYDIVVHGSDQILRKQPVVNNYDPIYFGKHKIKTKWNVSYAASMGILPQNNRDLLCIKNLLVHLDKISVRELELQSLAIDMGYSCSLHLDPTQLLSSVEWSQIMNIEQKTKEKYVLFYNLQTDAFDNDAIREFAVKRGFVLKTIYSKALGRNSTEDIYVADPEQFLCLVRGAEYIFTSSFHGLAFALIFHKNFYASFTRNEGRAKSLLTQLGINNRLLPPKAVIPSEDLAIDYDKVDNRFRKLRDHSMNYLHNL